VRISLTRAAMWFASLGRFPTTSDFDPNDRQHKMIAPETLKGRPPTVNHRLAPQVKLSKTPSRWRTPVVVLRGGDLPVWQG